MGIFRNRSHAEKQKSMDMELGETRESRIALFAHSVRKSLDAGFRSVRVRIFVLTALVSWIPLFAMDSYIYKSTITKQIDNYTAEVKYQGTTITRQMAASGYLMNLKENAGVNASFNTQINVMADIYDGRILIIDSAYQIVRDTYSLDTGKYNLSGSVMNCMKGINASQVYYNNESNYMECTLPIFDVRMDEIQGVMVFTSTTDDIMNLINTQLHQYRTIEFAICILVSLIAFFVSGILLKPFKKLEREFSRATQGDLTPIEVNDYVETERIAGVYNESLLRLKHLDESRQEFVSNVSHELKTPITSIRILADTLNSMQGAPVELYQEFMGDISPETDRESRIIDDLLEMVRLNRSNASLSVERVDINMLLETILKRLKPNADLRGIMVTLECLRQVEADVDELKFTRMITNLVENAIKYNKDEGSVDVTLNADQSYFYIKVVDTGVGIPADQIDKIFERFHRVDKARSRETGGTGLGLAICKDIAQLHHGMIRVSSDYGEGSTFIVRIPLVYIP